MTSNNFTDLVNLKMWFVSYFYSASGLYYLQYPTSITIYFFMSVDIFPRTKVVVNYIE